MQRVASTARVMHDLEAAFGAPVLEAYGMTEPPHQMASNPLPPGERKPGSVGTPKRTQLAVQMDGFGPATRAFWTPPAT